MEKLLTKLLRYIRYVLVFWIVSGVILIISTKIISTYEIVGLKDFLVNVNRYHSLGVLITLLVNLVLYVLQASVKKSSE